MAHCTNVAVIDAASVSLSGYRGSVHPLHRRVKHHSCATWIRTFRTVYGTILVVAAWIQRQMGMLRQLRRTLEKQMRDDNRSMPSLQACGQAKVMVVLAAAMFGFLC
eukprot:264524-Amphidinium_carterae.1